MYIRAANRQWWSFMFIYLIFYRRNERVSECPRPAHAHDIICVYIYQYNMQRHNILLYYQNNTESTGALAPTS